MGKETSIWKMNKNGSLVFSTKESVSGIHYRPKSLFEKPAAAYLVMILCAVLDFTLFYQLLSKTLYDDPMTMYMTTVGLLIGFDFAPCYLGMKIREENQGYKVNKVVKWALIASFALAFVVNFYLRIVMRDLSLPDLSSSQSLIGAVSDDKAANPLAPAFAVFAAVLPAVTSLCSFGVSYAVSNPLKKELEVLDQEIGMLEEDIIQSKSILREYETDNNYYERIQKDDEDRFKECIALTCEKAMYYADYVRERIKEFIKDNPTGINELSKEQYEHLLRLLEDQNADRLSEKVKMMVLEAEQEEHKEQVAA